MIHREEHYVELEAMEVDQEQRAKTHTKVADAGLVKVWRRQQQGIFGINKPDLKEWAGYKALLDDQKQEQFLQGKRDFHQHELDTGDNDGKQANQSNMEDELDLFMGME